MLKVLLVAAVCLLFAARELSNARDLAARIRWVTEKPRALPGDGARVHGEAKLSLAPGATYGACRVEFKESRPKASYDRYLDTHGGALVELDGRTLTVAKETPISFGAWAPDELPRDPSNDETKRVVEAIPPKKEKGTYRVFCLAQSGGVLVDGCTRGDTIVPCPSERTVLIAPGGISRARDWMRARAVGSLTLAAHALLIALMAVWSRASFRRSVVRTLGAHARGTKPRGGGLFWITTLVFVVTTFALLIMRVTPIWDSVAGPVIGAVLAGSVFLLSLVCMIARLFELSSALAAANGLATTSLAESRGVLRELTLTVPLDAPPLTRITVSPTRRLDLPSRIPVEDASGRGMLELERAVLDVAGEFASAGVRELKELARAAGATAAEAELLVAGLPVTRTNKGKTEKVTHAYAKQTIAPGDHLLVYGEVERVDPTVVGLEPVAGYREAETLPRVSAGARGMTVHVGDEATLCAGVRKEKRVLALLTLLAGGLLVAVGVAISALL